VTHARLEYFGRYIDWVFTTPLLLVGLIGVGLRGSDVKNRGVLLGTAIGADVLMIATGALAGLSTDNAHKYVWYAVSCIFFFGVLAVVWGPVRTAARAEGGAVASVFNRLLVVLTALWFVYPVLWILGSEGTAVLHLNVEVAAFAIIDLTAKVGFGFLLLTGVKQFEASADSSSQNGVPASGAVAAG
jgi:bacteriorhodopsin